MLNRVMTKDNIALAAVFKTAVPGTDTNKQVADLFRFETKKIVAGLT